MVDNKPSDNLIQSFTGKRLLRKKRFIIYSFIPVCIEDLSQRRKQLRHQITSVRRKSSSQLVYLCIAIIRQLPDSR